MEEWKECKLGEFFELHRGYDLTKSEIKEGPYPVVCSTSIMGYHNEYKVKAPGVVIGRSGTLGEVQFIDTDYWPHNTSLYVSDFKGNSPKFIKYFLQLFGTGNVGGGSAVPTLNRNHLQALTVRVPPLPTQQKIAAILSSLDDKIELNNKINTNLEQQAGALFKNWFVDFEPFGTEEKIESPIGTMIPRSLRMVQIADIPHLLETGKRPKGGAVAEGVPSIGAENVKQLGVFDFSSNKFIPQEYANSLGKGKINGYELLLYKDGGKPGTFIPHFSMFGEGFPYDECYINEHVFKLDFYDKGLNEFAYFYFNTEYVKNWLANNGGKAAIPGINQNDVKAIWIYDLENPKVKEFAKFVEPLFKQIFSNCKQNRELSIIRDTLLPKLMNGEIEV